MSMDRKSDESVKLINSINELFFIWREKSRYRNDPWAAYQAGYLQALDSGAYRPDRVPMPQNRKQAEGMLLIAENYLKYNKDK